ncbi:hypothetical protein MSG28_015516 [Choristoneura fumiferana]|uniref:Uncharacterized protein n=1 Tax=Choristoneura fumiferana TaxID=7141 RepID=A0ACC0KAJ5_CHOFU|nr:hypothetical protein MSG28_015516 [Choristoneura fumiferana]
MCSSPPFSVTKFVLVQNKGIVGCARGAFSCGPRCVLAPFVCDGRSDCEHGEDEAPPVCPAAVCQRPEMLNCSSGRCIPAAACCAPLCPSQPGCCSEHAQYNRKGEGYMEVEYPALYEDRHTPDDYGFIQSTIYTVTACALIFMIAVVLLVSALCKMHMKRAALRSYARAAAARHYTAHQLGRFQLSLPRLGRAGPEGGAPTYTRNGRTIRRALANAAVEEVPTEPAAPGPREGGTYTRNVRTIQ